ncbi:hypothetical protein EIP91_009808 [Steccherinum ochraceum]|uniref:CHAT domain-containing protein n=1 Tax=Steccherinum ochraceum TaxID=92696 RepID=A0A4R0RZP8_9APHY|nr:hypothetical protein EIP91_009808 [Steccherinum ochraceum]
MNRGAYQDDWGDPELLLMDPRIRALYASVLPYTQMLELAFKGFDRFQEVREKDCLQITLFLLCKVAQEWPGGIPPDLTVDISMRLGMAFRYWYDIHGHRWALFESISLLYQTMSRCPRGHARRANGLNNLGNSILTLFFSSDAIEDIAEAVEIFKLAVEVATVDDDIVHRNLLNSLRLQFWKVGDIRDLESTIRSYRCALSKAEDDGDLNSIARASANAAAALAVKSELLHDTKELDEAIDSFHLAVVCWPDSDPDQGSTLCGLGHALRRRFAKAGATEDLDESILHYRTVLNLYPPTQDIALDALDGLAEAVKACLEKSIPSPDEEETIGLVQTTLFLLPPNHQRRPGLLHVLGLLLMTRYRQSGKESDIEEAIACHTEAVQLKPSPLYLDSLATTRQVQYTQTANEDTLDESITLYRQTLAFEHGSMDIRGKVFALNNLGSAFLKKYERTSDYTFLEQAKDSFRAALELDVHAEDTVTVRCGLATIMHHEYKHSSNPEHLREAVALYEEALSALSMHHPERLSVLLNIGTVLLDSFRQTGLPDYLERSMAYFREGVALASGQSLQKAGALSSLGGALRASFSESGDISQLEECVLSYREALAIYPKGSSHSALPMNNLANALETRYGIYRRLEDLDEAITLHHAVLDIWTPGFSGRPLALNSLSATLQTRYSRFLEVRDIEEIIKLSKEALDLISEDDIMRSSVLINLANAYQSMYAHSDDPQDLEESMLLYAQVMSMPDLEERHSSLLLIGLANALETRAHDTHSPEDLSEAIELYQSVLDSRPHGHPDRGQTQYTLAKAYIQEFEDSRDPKSLTHAFNLFSESTRDLYGGAMRAFQTGIHWIGVTSRLRVEEVVGVEPSLQAFEETLNVIPKLAYLDQHVSRRLTALQDSYPVATDAASVAALYDFPEKAIRFLEMGRSVLWNSCLKLRTPLTGIPSHLVQRFSQIMHDLDAGSHQRTQKMTSELTAAVHIEQTVATRRRLASEFDDLVEEIQSIPGQSHFMKPPAYEELAKVALYGMVVILLENDAINLAIVIDPERDKPVVVELETFTQHLLEKAVKMWNHLNGLGPGTREADAKRAGRARRGPQASYEELLALLWTHVVYPIFVDLNMQPGKGDHRPRIWWCPTGKFAFLPVHAAGVYKDTSEGVSDYAVTSYTPTLNALLSAGKRAEAAGAEVKVLLVAQPNAPGQTALPNTATEIKALSTIVPDGAQLLLDGSDKLDIDGSKTTRAAVLQRLTEASILHLACHGKQDQKNPLDSGFYLRDGMLKVSDLIQLNMPAARFAFLSACESAQVDQGLPNEAVNLATSMLFTGFHSVVGTMWPMNDLDGPFVAEAVYRELFEGDEVNYGIVPYALDRAAQALRKKGFPASRWATFMHVGY